MEDGFGPSELSVQEISSNDEDVVEMRRKGGDVPGVASQAARTKTEHVIHKVSDDHFDDLLGNPGGSGQACHGAPPKDAPRKDSPNP